MAKKQPEKVTGEIVPFTPTHAMVRDLDYERYAPAIEAIADGETMQAAANAAGVTPDSLRKALTRSTELLSALKAHREAIRELAQVRGIALLHKRLDHAAEDPTNAKRLSNRDLTDILRSTKPYDHEQATRITINLDLPA